MSLAVRVFINASPVDVEAGTDVRTAIRAHDPALEASAAAGAALVTDARGIAVPLDQRLSAGSILRVVVRARRGEPAPDADA
ncbi:MAG TPA: hypothetical protein VFN08_13515 [Gemmatimonadales bacterium]|nr:hypothetical protein [Gemmatimonadales bacterium]